MPSSIVQHFTEPDDYAAAVRATTIDLTILQRGQFTAKLVKIDLHRLWMQRFFDNLPRVAHSSNMPGRAIIAFRTEPGPSLIFAGREIGPTAIVRQSESQDYHQRSHGSGSFGSMSLPIEEMASMATAFAGCDLMPPRDPMVVTPLPPAMERLQRLHAAAGQLAEEAPEIIANPDAAQGLEQALIEAMIDCLGDRQQQSNSLAQGQHAIVMRRFRRVLEENPEQPLFIPEICKAIKVPERTLRLCCREHLGMSPKRYLLLRRMHLARRALRAAATDGATVTDFATRYGFWQLGRFAVEYRSLFGETPSATLRLRGGSG